MGSWKKILSRQQVGYSFIIEIISSSSWQGISRGGFDTLGSLLC